MGDEADLTLVDLRTTPVDQGREGGSVGGPASEVLTQHLRGLGVEAEAALLSTALTLTPRRTWADGTPSGYLNFIDGRWDVWGEADRADWYNLPGLSGQVEIWFQGLPAGKLWLAVVEVQAWSSGAPGQFRVGSSDTGPQLVAATFQQQHLGALFEDRDANGSSLLTISPVNLRGFGFYRAVLIDVLG